MFVWFLRFLRGYLVLEIYGKNSIRLLNILGKKDFTVWKVKSDLEKNKYIFSLYLKDFKKIKPIIKKSGCKIHIIKKEDCLFIFIKIENISFL